MKSLPDLPLGITPKQELLLKAAIFPPDEARAYWEKWKTMHNISRFSVASEDLLPKIFDPLDYDSQRLLPLLYKNLEKSGDPIISALRGIYRYNWLKGNHFINRAAYLIEPLQNAGFDVMLLKGMPLAMMYYKNFGVRPMDDIDIFVPFHQNNDVIEFLDKNFNLKADAHESQLKSFGMTHAMHFTDGKGLDFDLHWHFHGYHLNEKSDEPMWSDRIPISLTPKVSTYMLSPTHQLYRNFTHGYNPAFSGSAIRWIPDSLIIMKETADLIEWDKLFELAKNQKFILPVCAMLRYLRKEFNVKYPAEVVDQLNKIHGTATEKYYYKILSKSNLHKPNELRYFISKASQIIFRYHLYQERSAQTSFPSWFFKKLKFTPMFKSTQV
jgi:hypothetical protein